MPFCNNNIFSVEAVEEVVRKLRDLRTHRIFVVKNQIGSKVISVAIKYDFFGAKSSPNIDI